MTGTGWRPLMQRRGVSRRLAAGRISRFDPVWGGGSRGGGGVVALAEDDRIFLVVFGAKLGYQMGEVGAGKDFISP